MACRGSVVAVPRAEFNLKLRAICGKSVNAWDRNLLLIRLDCDGCAEISMHLFAFKLSYGLANSCGEDGSLTMVVDARSVADESAPRSES